MKRKLILLLLLLLVLIILTLLLGRYGFSARELFALFRAMILRDELQPAQKELWMVLSQVRFPRIIAALLVGGALGVSGGVYQGMFRNPLVSPGILGVLSGAAFGAALGIVIFNSMLMTQALAFVFGCAAVGLAIFISLFFRRSSLLVMLLGGMISSALFTSFTSLLKIVADSNRQLPELVYWLMGSFANINESVIIRVGFPMLVLILYLSAQGKAVNVLSMGDEEALSMGMPVRRLRLQIILAATLLSALAVILTGIIQWVGLVIPHIMRFIVGPNNRILLPASAVGGAIFMLATDTLVRSIWTAELPVGVFTSLLALPLFIVSLYTNRSGLR